MSKPETSSSPALPGGEGREPEISDALSYELHRAFLNVTKPFHARGNNTWYLEPEYVSRLFAHLVPIIRREALASRDTRDAGAVAFAFYVEDADGDARDRPMYRREDAEHLARKLAVTQPQYAPYTVIPLVPAPPGRAGTDQEPQ